MEPAHHWTTPSLAVILVGLLGSLVCVNLYLMSNQPAASYKTHRSVELQNTQQQQAVVRWEFNGTMDLWVIAGQSNAWVGGAWGWGGAGEGGGHGRGRVGGSAAASLFTPAGPAHHQ